MIQGVGIQDISVLLLPTLIVVGGLLLHMYFIIVLEVLSGIILGVVLLGQYNGWVSTLGRPIDELFADYIIGMVILAVTGILVGILSNNMHRNLITAQLNQHALSETNRELERENAERIKAEDSLRMQEVRHMSLLTAIPDVILTFGANGEFYEVFTKAHRLFGSENTDIRGKSVYDVVPKNAGDIIMKVVHKALEEREVQEYEYSMPGPGGKSWFQARVVAYDEQGESRVLWLARDVTAQKRAELALAESEERYRTLFENAPIGIYRTNASGEIVVANPTLVQLLGFNSFDELASRNLETEGFSFTTPRNKFIEQIERDGQVRGYETIWVRKDRSEVHIRENARRVRNHGGMDFYDGTVEDITEQKRAWELIERSKLELELAYDVTLQGWSRALEMREHETAGHSNRVVELTLALSQSLGINSDHLVNIKRGALLHDIGKMGIPDAILLKPGPLTEDEWVIMRQHPIYSYQLLAQITYLAPALDIPYAHHERWDGSGYPRGLAGDSIPLSARIFAVTDVWDALTSNRPYRPAWSKDEAREYLTFNAGRLFDEQVVASFFKMHLDG